MFKLLKRRFTLNMTYTLKAFKVQEQDTIVNFYVC